MKRAKTLSHTTAVSRPGHLLCPICVSGELVSRGAGAARCESCNYVFFSSLIKTLEQIVALPDALGRHACEECAHPEMRLLPDGTFHCPVCRSEVLAL